ncbi:28S ribosomal protein S23, mitochondrial [Leptidea sinapis]|uniref:28S ribosomal protein S23, mitochondrial n=1 Tax=Leptidea sinapis TaxID=189913 RepID=UPI0021C34FC9|nr:28S ribosomal protein S23, mitochondrial [Leptidea sinapis]
MATSRLEKIGTIYTRVEGLLKSGGIKPDDRPLWFDVYRAFPPFVEPKYARPKPDIKHVRQILYKEDVVRAKFHSQGHGIGINMLNPSGETQIKRLIQKYEKLEAEGIPDAELIDKSLTEVVSEQALSIKSKIENPESATAQVLGVDVKNIFKE